LRGINVTPRFANAGIVAISDKYVTSLAPITKGARSA